MLEHSCYLLFCVNPLFKGRTYIGYTVDPNRRIKQHNGGVEKGGASKTSQIRPWEMILIIQGFPNELSGLRFEWAWQHPTKSRRLKHVIAKKKVSEKSLEYNFRVLTEMLQVGPWKRLPLTIRWIDEKYEINFNAKKQPPIHMPIVYGPVPSCKKPKDSLKDNTSEDEPIPTCKICSKLIITKKHILQCLQLDCEMTAHIFCLAKAFLSAAQEDTKYILPVEGDCPHCGQNLLWGDLLRHQHMKHSDDSEEAL